MFFASFQPQNQNRDSVRMQKFNRIINENYGPLVCVANVVCVTFWFLVNSSFPLF